MGKSQGIKRFFALLLSTIFTITQLMTVPIFAVENDKNEEQLLEVTPSLTPESTNNTYKVGESFDINYDIKPKDINKKEYDDWYKSKGKKKEIVLVMDTSGSMEYSVKPTSYNIQNRIVTSKGLNVEVKGHFYQVEIGLYPYIIMNEEKYYIEGNKCYKICKANSRLNIAKNKAEEFIDQFKSEKNVSIGLVSFASKINLENPLTSDFTNLKSKIKDLQAGGGTNIGEALRKAHYMLNKSNNKEADKYIVLMTDGFPTAFTLLDYEKSIQKEIQDKYWFNNYLGYVENNSKQICEFVNINNPKFKEGFDFENQEYAINYGDNDLNNYALNYSKKIAQNVKNDNINSFIIGFSEGANSEKLNDIAKAAGGEYREANDEDALKTAYEKIGNKVKAPLIKNIKFNINVPEGIEIEKIEDKSTNNVFKINKNEDLNLENILYDDNTDKYKANKNIKISVKFKINDKNSNENSNEIKATLKYDYNGENIINTSKNIIIIEEDKNPKDKIQLIQNTPKKDVYKLNENIPITYKIIPENTINKSKYNKKYNNKKKIVLVLDTSGSMNDSLNYAKCDCCDVVKKYYNCFHILKQIELRGVGIIKKIDFNLYIDFRGRYYYLKGNKCYKIPPKETKLQAVKEKAIEFIENFKNNENVEIALVDYSNKSNINYFNDNGKVFINLVDDNEIDNMKSKISNLKAEGGTNIGDGVRKATSLFENDNSDTDKYIVLLTDGVPTAYTCYEKDMSKIDFIDINKFDYICDYRDANEIFYELDKKFHILTSDNFDNTNIDWIKGLNEINKELDDMKKEFDNIDKEFDDMKKEFDNIDKEFDDMARKMYKIFNYQYNNKVDIYDNPKNEPNGKIMQDQKSYYFAYKNKDKLKEEAKNFPFKLENNDEKENYIVKFGDVYDEFALEYAKQALKKANDKGIKNFVIGFSEGANEDIVNMCKYGNNEYLDAKDKEKLESVYNKIATQIKKPSIKDIKFEINLPDGLQICDNNLNKSDNIYDINISDDKEKLTGKIKDITYLQENKEEFKLDDKNKETSFTINLTCKKKGNYVLGNEKQNSAYLSYIDVDGNKIKKQFGPIININTENIKISIKNFGVFLNGEELKILDKSVSLINNFRYQLGTVIQVGDGQKIEGVVNDDLILKSSISGITSLGKKNFKLYSLNNNKLALVTELKNSDSDKIKIPVASLKNNNKYVLVQDYIPCNASSKNCNIINKISLVNDNKTNSDNTIQLKISLVDVLPDLD